MKREAGYYWVNYTGDWMIAEWCIYESEKFDDEWLIAGIDDCFNESEFDEIDENRITR